MTSLKKYFLLITATLISANLTGQKQIVSILPEPVEVQLEKGRFSISSETLICVDDQKTSMQDAEVFNEYLSKYYGFSLPVSQSKPRDSNVIIVKSIVDPQLPNDAYRLHVAKKSILIEGKGAGIFYAFQTLKQLLPAQKSETLRIPRIKIYDYPQYSWRGMHLDVCRHFFTPEEVKKYIDYLSFYKMNTFHWHLTDDQGWRIQIDKYPKLTEVGGYRNGTLIGHAKVTLQKFDTVRYGGFYTKEQIRDIVAYAERRHVQVVPEIELPGHALAAISAYPEYSCTGGPFQVERSWGVFDDVFCAKDKTIQFLKDILSEVMDLFPGKYIHIGGDECPKVRWQKCKECQKIMKREGLKDENELQSYVTRTIEKFVNSKGKTIIGWDEILDGGVAPNAVVMSWRGTEGAVAAANLKHDVVMCPGSYCYFDYYQGDTLTEPMAIGGFVPLEKVYSFNPMPDSLSQDQKKFILGSQGNVWTEYITSFDRVEYMAIPRMIALSEVLWSKPENHNYGDFYVRLQKHTPLLDMMKVNYRKLDK